MQKQSAIILNGIVPYFPYEQISLSGILSQSDVDSHFTHSHTPSGNNFGFYAANNDMEIHISDVCPYIKSRGFKGTAAQYFRMNMDAYVNPLNNGAPRLLGEFRYEGDNVVIVLKKGDCILA